MEPLENRFTHYVDRRVHPIARRLTLQTAACGGDGHDLSNLYRTLPHEFRDPVTRHKCCLGHEWAELIVVQASAQAAPVLGNEPKVVKWIRAAAIVARVDPLERGYLVRNNAGEWHIPRFRIEDSIHNLSDADFVASMPAATTADSLLKQLAQEFGFDPNDTARYNNRFRNRVLSELTCERVLTIYTNSGVDGVRAEIKRRIVF